MISLEPRNAPSFGSIYKLSLMKLEVMQKYITENLKKGFICHFQFSCSTSMAFCKEGGWNFEALYRLLRLEQDHYQE